MFNAVVAVFWALLFVLPPFAFAQDDRAAIDQSRIPLEAGSVDKFVPPGWIIEEQVSGDLTGDSVPDYALKLVEDMPAKKDNFPNERQRALILLLGNRDGKFSRAAVTDRLLQCTTCGGAFYGVMEAPAHVNIGKGVLVVEQDNGSREVSAYTYRFRYEPDSKKFRLIGFDSSIHDRLSGNERSESTNYLTAERTVRCKVDGKNFTSKKSVSKDKVYIEKVDSEQYAADAVQRLEAVEERLKRKTRAYDKD
ncbi:MAG: hypothetical protein AB9866_17140 [Syntrophobacteraceae bacterium]